MFPKNPQGHSQTFPRGDSQNLAESLLGKSPHKDCYTESHSKSGRGMSRGILGWDLSSKILLQNCNSKRALLPKALYGDLVGDNLSEDLFGGGVQSVFCESGPNCFSIFFCERIAFKPFWRMIPNGIVRGIPSKGLAGNNVYRDSPLGNPGEIPSFIT